MREGSGFNWQMLGAPDYAQAGALVDSLPVQIRRRLRNDMREILQNIVYLGWQQAQRGGRGMAYCWPSEAWFASKLGKSVRTVQRCLVLLKEAGLVEWRRRFNPLKAPTSNLYQLGKSFVAALYARTAKKVQQIRDTTYLSHKNLKKVRKAEHVRVSSGFFSQSVVKKRETPRTLAYSQSEGLASKGQVEDHSSPFPPLTTSPTTSDFLEKLRNGTLANPSRHAVAYSPPVVEDTKTTEERRALLKKQYERLKTRGL